MSIAIAPPWSAAAWRRFGQRRSRFSGGALRARPKRRQAAALQGGARLNGSEIFKSASLSNSKSPLLDDLEMRLL